MVGAFLSLHSNDCEQKAVSSQLGTEIISQTINHGECYIKKQCKLNNHLSRQAAVNIRPLDL